MRKHIPGFLIALTLGLIALTSVLAGCTHSGPFTFAKHLEKNGHYTDALAAYQAALAQTSPTNRRGASQIYYRMGECLVRLERMPEAFRAFDQAVQVDPENADAHIRLGEFMVSAGLPGAAEHEAETAMRIQPRNSEAVALLGAAQEKLGEHNRAAESYRKSLAMDPARPDVAIALADLYNQEDRSKDAESVLEAAAKASPKRASPLLALARLHEQQGEIPQAEAAYRAAVAAEDTRETNLRLAQFLQRTARIADAEQVLRRLDARQPAHSTELADFELIAGQPLTAIQEYQSSLAKQPKDAPTAKQDSSRGRVASRMIEADLDVAAHGRGAQRDQALQQARAHLKQYGPDLDEATRNTLAAEISLAANDLPTASAQAEKAVALAPGSAAAHYTAGMVRLRSGDSDGAIHEWLKALESDERFAPARLALAEHSLSAGDAERAEAYVLPVVRSEPGNAHGLDVFARVLAAEHRYPAAMTIAVRMEALDRKSAAPHILLGNIALADNRPGEALIDFERAVMLDPDSPEAMHGLTKVYQTGRLTRPILLRIERVAAAKPKSAVLMEIAGRLFAEHGWNTDAERCLKAALAIDPKRATAAAALAETFAATGDLPAAVDSAAQTGGNAAAMMAGVKAQQRNDVRTAIADYERAIRGGESTGVAANNLAWLYAEQGTNLGRALSLAHAAQSLSPDNPAVLDTVGVVHLRRREYSEAIKTLEAARALSERTHGEPELSAQIRRHLSEAYWKAGKTQAAKAVEQGASSPLPDRAKNVH